MKIKLLPDYPYLYETHMHTNVGSACGRNSGAEMAAACKEYGYTGAFITDHNWGGNTAIDRSLPWRKWMAGFAGGYRDAKRYGDEHDMDIFFGMEAGFPLSQGHSNPAWDDAARELAARCGKSVTAGSDTHSTRMLGGGMAFRRRLTSPEDFCAAVLGDEDYILSDGRYWRRKDGEIMDTICR